MSSLSRHNEIMRIYSRRQDEDRSALERRRGEIYEKIPQIAQLDKRPGTIAMQRYRAYMSGSDANALEALGGELTEVTHERVRLLEQAGYPADYLQMQYTCPICRDTGYDDDGNYCRCYIQMEQEMLRTQSQLRTAVRRENFDKLSMEYYDDEQIIEELGTTQRAYMEKIIARCRRFAEEFGDGANIMFVGGTGTGKSFLSHCICAQLLQQDRSVMYLSATDMFEIMAAARRDQGADDGMRDMRERILDAQLLVIDDLGSELTNAMTVTDLFYILEKRMNGGLSTIISTNLDINSMRDIYSERITSRLQSRFDILPLYGRDIRLMR